VELTLLLLRSGFKIRGVPINWQELPGSKVSVLKDSIRMFSGILRIKKRHGTANERQRTPVNFGERPKTTKEELHKRKSAPWSTWFRLGSRRIFLSDLL